MITNKFSPDFVQSLAQKANIDISMYDISQLAIGLEIEQEHKDVTHGNLATTLKIAIAHLKEKADYYTRLLNCVEQVIKENGFEYGRTRFGLPGQGQDYPDEILVKESNSEFEKPINIILYGLPGSNRDGFAKMLEKEYHLTRFSVGDFLRDAISKRTEIKHIANKLVTAQRFLSNKLIFSLLQKQVSKSLKQGIIFDGFPLTVLQSISLDKMLQKQGSQLNCVIEIVSSEDSIIEKINSYMTEEQKGSVSEDKVRKKLRDFKRWLEPVVSHYKQQGQLVSISGDDTLQNVYSNIKSAIQKRLGLDETVAIQVVDKQGGPLGEPFETKNFPIKLT